MMTSSRVPLKGLQQNQLAKAPPLETYSSPIQQGKSQDHRETAVSKEGDLGRPASKEPMLAEDLWIPQLA